MATVINGSQIKLNDGKVVQASQGGWYDGQQFWGGTLSAPGVINSQSNQQGAGQAVSKEVVQQTNPANWDYIQKQQQSYTGNTQSLPGEAGQSSGLGDMGITAPETINLPQLYENFYKESGIRDIEAELAIKTNEYNSAVAKIKDNPYLSEATMTGRIKKITEKFDADKLNYQNQVATKKADIETRLNLESKQFDINSQVAKQAFEQYQSLLSSGALDNASGEDIANITRSTGLSSSMIQSAIDANKQKNVSISTIQFDDGTNQGFVVINDKTGEIINRQTVGASTKKTGGGTTTTKAEELKQNTANLTQSVKNGITLKSLINSYYPALSVEDIYRIYNQYSPNGKAKETLAEAKQGKFNY